MTQKTRKVTDKGRKMTEQGNVGGNYADEEGMHETVNVRQVGIDNY